jgi:hypothetical protein
MENSTLISMGQLGKMQMPKATQAEIRKVANGFIIQGYGVEVKIANTLDEALALVKKELE